MRAAAASVMLVGALFLAGCLTPEASPTTARGASLGAPPGASSLAAAQPHVVVATYDTGTNPFHPCFRRADWQPPSTYVTGFPADAQPLELVLRDNYADSLEASQPAIDSIQDHTLYYVVGTNLLYYGADRAKEFFVDKYPHGAQASSQIGCEEFGMAPEALLVILNWYTNSGARSERLVSWAAEQEWIDVVHLNIQDTPNPLPSSKYVPAEKVIQAGKFLVIAGGNGVSGGGANYPMELSRYNGPPGSLIAGANDNAGYTSFSNLNPHVVMDGSGTRAAHPRNFGSTSFGGTSSASPRITGYVSHLLYELRVHYGYLEGPRGDILLTLGDGQPRPSAGPLMDGRLSVAELHEVVRKTANPNPHASKWDGNGSGIPQPLNTPYAVYAKMGYGEISEHTIGAAFNVTIGASPMPIRQEDAIYERSEWFRRTWWGS